ncbi:hypothetical protein TrST_g8628 [Triparma strigata]|uniref:RING-type domain-containing protein n=1 Tax=Triparma strigata TaxID=1606541 RepID=A0A9W7C0B1_9STRA|nr:hypothetical protein TrST_g8628 [Triparma strigata]
MTAVTCSVCIEDIPKWDAVTTCAFGHQHCKGCTFNMIVKGLHADCPMCRCPMFTKAYYPSNTFASRKRLPDVSLDALHAHQAPHGAAAAAAGGSADTKRSKKGQVQRRSADLLAAARARYGADYAGFARFLLKRERNAARRRVNPAWGYGRRVGLLAAFTGVRSTVSVYIGPPS